MSWRKYMLKQQDELDLISEQVKLYLKTLNNKVCKGLSLEILTELNKNVDEASLKDNVGQILLRLENLDKRLEELEPQIKEWQNDKQKAWEKTCEEYEHTAQQTMNLKAAVNLLKTMTLEEISREIQ